MYFRMLKTTGLIAGTFVEEEKRRQYVNVKFFNAEKTLEYFKFNSVEVDSM